MTNRLGAMHELAPQLTEAVAKRIITGDLHDEALRDLGAFVHRTVVEDEHAYAVRIDDGALLDAGEQTRTSPPASGSLTPPSCSTSPTRLNESDTTPAREEA